MLRAVAPALATVKVKKGADAQAHSTNDITEGGVNAGWGPTEAGRVIRSFQAGSLAIPWGIGQVGSGNLWISDASAKKNHEFRTDGTPTGTSADTPWVGTFGGDMAYDTRHNLMCQVAVGGDNGIHCFDPATGAERDKITGTFPWTAISQRGLAYREDDDSFYIGGWNEGVVYHVKGLGAMDKGAVLGSCNSTDKGISGMAWNPAAEVLWVQTNSATDTIYRINPETCTVLGTIAHPAPGFNGAGLDLDPEGNLWVMKQKAPGTVYLIESGVPAYNDVSWLGLVPRNGTLQPNGQINVALTINTANLAPGAYLARLYFLNTGGRNPSVTIPVSLIVSGYQRGVNAGGGQYLDSSGDTWVADQIYRRGGFGYMYDRGTQVVRQSIAGTPDPSLYQDCRVDPYLYRFDNLPSGTYQVELRLAELTQGIKAGDRLFDVIIKDELVAPAVDIAYRKGVRAADNHVFYTTVTDGYLDVRFVQSFDGTNDPVVNAIRITQRPDR